MKAGVVYPQVELGGDTGAVKAFAQAAEDLGYDHIVMYDHVLGAVHAGREPKLTGPYKETDPFHEPLIAFAYLAGITKNLEMATGVIILPQRQTVLFAKQGLAIKLGAKVSKAEIKGDTVEVTYADAKGEQKIVVDKLLVAVGRRAFTEGVLGDGTGVKVDARGRIDVDEHCWTGVEGVWAVGDCVRGAMLAHKGFEEGMAVAELIAGKAGHVNYDTIPWVIYTEPEIAWAGKTEEELKAANIPYKTGSFPFAAVGRAVAMNETAGQVKVIAHAETDRILGVHMVGPGVSELIAEAVVAMEFHGSAEDLARIVHAHPTLSEAVHEAALSVDKRAIHKAN